MNDIFAKLKTDFEYFTGKIYKGLVQALGAGFASRLNEFLDKLNFIKKNAFTATQDKDYLYLDASAILPPLSAETASGLAIFYGTNGKVIPATTQIKDDINTFKVSSDAVISTLTINSTVTVAGGVATVTVANQLTTTKALVNGVEKQITIVDSNTIQFEAGTLITSDAVEIIVERAIASVVAVEAGVASNRVLNDVLKITQTIDGVNTECGVLQISGGIDDEDVEVYRLRVLHFKANPQAPFSKPHIIRNIRERMPTIKYVWVKGGEVIDGTVQVFAMNESYGLTSYEQNEALTNTKAIAPANLDVSAISVSGVIVSSNDVVIQNLLPSSSGLMNEIEKNIKTFFDSDMYERTITQENLQAIIYSTTNGVEKPTSFTLISGWQVSATNTFWKLNNVIFQ